MSKYLISIVLLWVLKIQWVHAQTDSTWRRRSPFDSTKKDWTCLDRMYLITKLIHPRAMIYPGKDTLVFEFELPEGKQDTSGIAYKRDVAYHAIAMAAFQKDSMHYKVVSLEQCFTMWDCHKWQYDLQKHAYSIVPFEQKLEYITSSFYWPTIGVLVKNYDDTKTIVLLHQVDTSDAYSSSERMKVYNSYVDFIIGDMVYKSKPAIKKLYTKLLHVYYCGNQYLGQAGYELNGPEFPKVYGYSLWISFDRNYGF